MNELAVVLAGTRNPLNIGAVARAMSNFGCFDLRLVDAWREAVSEARSATHAGIVLQNSRDFPTLTEAVADCSLVVGTASIGPREARHEIVRLERAAERIHNAAGRVALVFGSEKTGMNNQDMARCHFLLTIPSDAGEHGSMNLGQAAAVCLYELARNRPVPELDNRKPSANAQPADMEATDRVTTLLLEALERSGYVKERTAESLRMKIQRLILRTGMNRSDAEIWQGMIRQILWKLRNEKERS